MTIGVYVLVCVALILASTVHTASGFGQGLVAAPLLRLIHPELLPGPIVAAAVASSLVVALRNSRRNELAKVAPALGGRVVGNLTALGLLATLSETGLSIAIGVLVLGFVTLRATNVAVALSPGSLVGAGVASGIGGTVAGLGGAPMALLFQQHANAREFRGPLGWYTLIGSSLSALTLAAVGTYDTETLKNSVLLLPPLGVGWILARRVTPIIDRGYLRPLVLGLSASSAALLLLGELL